MKPIITAYKDAQRILKAYDRKIFKIKNVNYTGIRFEDGQWKYDIGVTEWLPEHNKLLNPNINIKGLPVVPEEGGEITAVGIDRTLNYRPASPGMSIGHKDITAGTFGCTCFKNGVKHILSNDHVLGNCQYGEIGDSIIQPGMYDGGTDPADRIATLAGFIPIVWSDPDNPNIVDCAIALPDDEGDLLDRLLELAYPYGHKEAQIGMAVAKSGRTTAINTGTITGFSGLLRISYGPYGQAYFTDQIRTTKMLWGGDSGSVLIDVADNKAIGLGFAGNTSSYHNRMTEVVDALDISIYEFPELESSVEHEFQAQPKNIDGEGDWTASETFTTLVGPIDLAGTLAGVGALAAPLRTFGPDIITNDASKIVSTSGTLNAQLTDLGQYPQVYVWFQWGLDPEESDYLWATSKQVMSAVGTFSIPVTQLVHAIEYHFRAKASALDGSGEVSAGNKTFTTLARPPFHRVLTGSVLCNRNEEVIKLSQLFIDDHKPWGLKSISSLKEVAESMEHGDIINRGRVGLRSQHKIVKMPPGESGQILAIRAGHLQWEDVT